MTLSFLCYRLLRVAKHPRCSRQDLPQLVHLPRGRHRLQQNSGRIRVQATGVRPYSCIQVSLEALLPHRWVRATGRRHILLGMDMDKFDIQNIVHGNFYLKFKVKNKSDNFEWILIALYGTSQEEEKESFLQELVQTCNIESLPLIIGDFNIIRSPHENNNNRYNDKWPFLFNAVFNNLDLREIEFSGRQFTWANYLETPTYEKLDRILVST
jgi:hypothetical protein